MWIQMHQSLHLLGFAEPVVKNIFGIVAAVLHLGNIKFDDIHHNDTTPCDIINEDLIPLIASLISVPREELKDGLIYYKKVIAGETMHLPMTEKQCIEGRDSMAKALYEQLFLWIVDKLNEKVNENSKG